MLPFYFLRVGSQVIADASYVEKFQNVQGKHNLHLQPKLTNIHVIPNTRQRMRVKYVAQCLSHSVYSGKLESSYSLAFIISLILSLPKAKEAYRTFDFLALEKIGDRGFESLPEPYLFLGTWPLMHLFSSVASSPSFALHTNNLNVKCRNDNNKNVKEKI